MTPFDEEIAEAIRTLRATLQESREDFAKRLGISHRTLARYELEKPPRQSSSYSTFAEIADEAKRNDLKEIFEHAHKEFGPRQRTLLSQLIRRFRTALNLTQDEFAKAAGLSPISVARYETNTEPKAAALNKLIALARKSNLPDYVQIFEGSTSVLAKFQKREGAALRLLIEHYTKEKVSLQDYLPLRLMLAVLFASEEQCRQLNDLLAGQLPKVDAMVTRIAGMADAREATKSRSRPTNEVYPPLPQPPLMDQSKDLNISTPESSEIDDLGPLPGPPLIDHFKALMLEIYGSNEDDEEFKDKKAGK